MLHLISIFLASFEGEKPEPEPDYFAITLGWWAYLAFGVLGIYVGFVDAWFMRIGVIIVPLGAIVFLNRLKNAR
jgi:hypothetical protein